MTQCRLTTQQLKEQAVQHRLKAKNFLGPTHHKRAEEDQIYNYRTAQTILAEVYEELVERRNAETQPRIKDVREKG